MFTCCTQYYTTHIGSAFYDETDTRERKDPADGYRILPVMGVRAKLAVGAVK
jgi:hypothetical protein